MKIYFINSIIQGYIFVQSKQTTYEWGLVWYIPKLYKLQDTEAKRIHDLKAYGDAFLQSKTEIYYINFLLQLWRMFTAPFLS